MGSGTFSTRNGGAAAEHSPDCHGAYLEFANEVEWRRRNGDHLASVYRIYLRDREGSIVARRTIATETDDDAIKVASIVCSAVCGPGAGFEVWKGETRLMMSRMPAQPPSFSELLQRTRQTRIDLEIAREDSRRTRAESERLRAQLEALCVATGYRAEAAGGHR